MFGAVRGEGEVEEEERGESYRTEPFSREHAQLVGD